MNMKKIAAAAMVAAVLTVGSVSAFAAERTTPARAAGQNTACTTYVDANGDGLCDNRGTASCTHTGTGCGLGRTTTGRGYGRTTGRGCGQGSCRR